MHIEEYDYLSGVHLGPADQLTFGTVIAGQHSPHPVLFRIASETPLDLHNLQLFLTSKDGWSDAEFGCYTNPVFTRIESGDPRLSHFSGSGVSIGWDSGISDYIWIDAEVPTSQGVAQVAFRLTYDE